MTALGESLPEIFLDVGSIPTVSTIVKAPERNLWSSFIATDCSDFKLSGGFADFDENAHIPSHTYPDIGFQGGKVRKLVRSEVPDFAKKYGHA